jgi:hypothetical protein
LREANQIMSARIKARLKKLLSQEKGAIAREWGARWPVALVYPHIYPVAMGNLGFQVIYHLLNAQPGLVCERAFLPSPQDWEEHRRTGTPILSLESQRPLTDFAAVAFSISFEGDYPQVLQILEGGRIPLLARDRGPGDSLVLAGGVAANRHLREKLQEAVQGKGIRLFYPPLELCVDNAAMVAALGWRMLREGEASPLDVDASAILPLNS